MLSAAMLLLQIAALSSPSSFHGTQVITNPTQTTCNISHRISNNNNLTMRKQKASDKRTARMQRGQIDNSDVTFTPPPLSSSSSSSATQILNSSPKTKNQWKNKKIELRAAGVSAGAQQQQKTGGRGRARKRFKLYNSLASYHSTFLELISEEYQMEVSLTKLDVCDDIHIMILCTNNAEMFS